MVSSKSTNEQTKEPALTKRKPEDLNKPSPKPISSNKATHGSVTSASARSDQGPTTLPDHGGSWAGNRGASCGNGQRETWALHNWLEQAPRDEPWRPGSRKA